MKTYYLFILTFYNGTLVMKQDFSLYPTRNLAEKVRDKIRNDQSLAESEFLVTTRIEEVNYYENESKVPILNEAE